MFSKADKENSLGLVKIVVLVDRELCDYSNMNQWLNILEYLNPDQGLHQLWKTLLDRANQAERSPNFYPF